MSGRKWGLPPAAPGVRPYRYRRVEATVPEPRKTETPAVDQAPAVDPERVARVADLVKEFCPDLNPVLAESYALEALEEDSLPATEDLEPQARWRAMRENAPAPNLSRRLAAPYDERRRQELIDAAPRDTDYPGRDGRSDSHRMAM